MARYYSRRYRRYRPRKYLRRYFRRRFRKFVNGSSRSQVRVKIPVSLTETLTQDGATHRTAVAKLDAFHRADTTLRNQSVFGNPLYSTYASLYDEVQCIGCKIRLSFTNAVGAATLPAIKVHSCWDRRFGQGEATSTADEVINSASYMPSSAINNSICKMQRSCYASDLIEKIQWHDCSLSPVGATTVVADGAYEAAGVNPNFFCPAFFFCVEEVPSDVAWVNISVMVDAVFYFKFRSPRYGGSSSGSAKSLALPGGDFVNPDDDMDDGDELIDLDAGKVASLSAMADMQPAAAAVAMDAPAPPVTQTRANVAAQRAADRDARNTARRAVFGGRGSLNV